MTWTPEMDAQLGTRSDREMAALWGLSHVAVGRRRRKLGIPAHSTSKWAPHNEALLGTMPDAVLARALGVSVAAVHSARRRRGVEPYRGPRPQNAEWLGAPRAIFELESLLREATPLWARLRELRERAERLAAGRERHPRVHEIMRLMRRV